MSVRWGLWNTRDNFVRFADISPANQKAHACCLKATRSKTNRCPPAKPDEYAEGDTCQSQGPLSLASLTPSLDEGETFTKKALFAQCKTQRKHVQTSTEPNHHPQAHARRHAIAMENERSKCSIPHAHVSLIIILSSGSINVNFRFAAYPQEPDVMIVGGWCLEGSQSRQRCGDVNKRKSGIWAQDLNLVSRLVYVNLQRTHYPLVDGKDNQMIPVKQSVKQDLNLLLETRNELHECWNASKKTNSPLLVEYGSEAGTEWKRHWNVGNDLLSQRYLQKYHHFSIRCGSGCGLGLDKLCLAERRASQIQTAAYISELAP